MAEDKLIFQMIAWKAFAGYKLPHTSLRGVDVLFFWGGGVVTFDLFFNL